MRHLLRHLSADRYWSDMAPMSAGHQPRRPSQTQVRKFAADLHVDLRDCAVGPEWPGHPRRRAGLRAT